MSEHKEITITVFLEDRGDMSVGIWPAYGSAKLTTAWLDDKYDIEEFSKDLAKFLGDWFDCRGITEKEAEQERKVDEASWQEELSQPPVERSNENG